jgi:hypothetical protein
VECVKTGYYIGFIIMLFTVNVILHYGIIYDMYTKRDEFIKLYGEDRTDKEIAEITGQRINTVTVMRMRLGLPRHKDIQETLTQRRRRYWMKKKYGITDDTRQAMFIAQQGKCAICGKIPDGLLSIDHNHTTGKVRGLLCKSCNSALGLVHENTDILQGMMDYINAHIAG